MDLQKKSLTELRGIAQAFGVKDFFKKEKHVLIQDIFLKQQSIKPPEKIEIPQPQYDPVVMTRIPARLSNEVIVRQYLEPYIKRGLRFELINPEEWRMSFDKKEDTGSMRQPPRVIMKCADKLVG